MLAPRRLIGEQHNLGQLTQSGENPAQGVVEVGGDTPEGIVEKNRERMLAAVPLQNGEFQAQVDQIRKRSKASGNGPWVTDYDEMARKTAVRRLCKYLPLSVEMAEALEAEDRAEFGAPAEVIDIPAEQPPTKTTKIKAQLADQNAATKTASGDDVPGWEASDDPPRPPLEVEDYADKEPGSDDA